MESLCCKLLRRSRIFHLMELVSLPIALRHRRADSVSSVPSPRMPLPPDGPAPAVDQPEVSALPSILSNLELSSYTLRSLADQKLVRRRLEPCQARNLVFAHLRRSHCAAPRALEEATDESVAGSQLNPPSRKQVKFDRKVQTSHSPW